MDDLIFGTTSVEIRIFLAGALTGIAGAIGCLTLWKRLTHVLEARRGRKMMQRLYPPPVHRK